MPLWTQIGDLMPATPQPQILPHVWRWQTLLPLAERAGVAKRTVERLESGAVATQLSGFLRVCRALGLLEGLETLVPEPAASPIAQLKLQGRQRKRASKAKAVKARKTKWTWGDST